MRGVALADYVTLEIEVEESIAKQEPFATRGPRVTERDFPELVAAIRQQALAEFGPNAAGPPD